MFGSKQKTEVRPDLLVSGVQVHTVSGRVFDFPGCWIESRDAAWIHIVETIDQREIQVMHPNGITTPGIEELRTTVAIFAHDEVRYVFVRNPGRDRMLADVMRHSWKMQGDKPIINMRTADHTITAVRH